MKSVGVQDVRSQKAMLWRTFDNLAKLKRMSKRNKADNKKVLEELRFVAGLQEGLRKMAGKSKKVTTSDAWKGFVKCELSDAEKAQYGVWDLEDEDVFVLYGEIVSSGYKFGQTLNEQNGSYIASFTCRDLESPNHGFTLSAFAGTWFEALRVLVFKHVIVLQGNWSERTNRPTAQFG